MYDNQGNLKYEGAWLNDKPDGMGKSIMDEGKYYIGQFKNGKMHGRGQLFNKNGISIYDGEWINDKPEGYGTQSISNGNIYSGYIKNGMSVTTFMQKFDVNRKELDGILLACQVYGKDVDGGEQHQFEVPGQEAHVCG